MQAAPVVRRIETAVRQEHPRRVESVPRGVAHPDERVADGPDPEFLKLDSLPLSLEEETPKPKRKTKKKE